MGNVGSRAPAMLGKTHVPDFEWKIHDFSALLETKAASVYSGPFHCSGYTWYLQVSPVHKVFGVGTPYVALNLILHQHTLEQGHIVHAVFEFSIYNHSNGMYCGCKAYYNFDFNNYYSKKEFLIPLEELLSSSAFLVDDSCVVGVEILKIVVFSPERTAVLVEKKATTVRNLFLQKKGFIKGTYTWTMNNFLEYHFRRFVHSPTFEVGGHKWYIRMYPRGIKRNTDCLSLYLCQDVSNELPLESRNLVKMTLSIQDQKNGKYFTRTSSGLVEFAIGWGWANFIPLNRFKDPSGGYLVESNCVVKADFTIIGSSSNG